MAQTISFGDKVIKLPGSYARVVSGIKTETPLSTYSNVLLVDMGAGANYNSVKGIIGRGKESIYNCDKDEANYYIKGGPLAPVIEGLFSPQQNVRGIGRLFILKAATTTPASVQGEISLFGGAIKATSLKTVEEGKVINTEIKEGVLRQGFSFKAIWDENSERAYIEVWQGTYEGNNFGGYQIGLSESESNPICVFRSKRCQTPAELATVLQKTSEFKSILEMSGITYESTFTEKVNTTYSFSGGTDVYITNVAEVLPMTKDIDYSLLLVLGPNGQITQVNRENALNHILTEAKGIKQMVVFEEYKSDAIELAKEMDNDAVIVVSGKILKTSKASPTGFISHDPMVTAAYCIGRIFGLSPEIPGTLKSLNIDGMDIQPTDSDQEDMLDFGVISPYYDSDLATFCLTQVVNSLQANTQLINENATTYSVQAKRILAAVVQNLQFQSKVDFWGGEEGVNKANLSDAYLKAWTKTLLDRMTYRSNKTDNNYLLTSEVTKVETDGDAKKVYLSVTINGEITKVLFLVTILG